MRGGLTLAVVLLGWLCLSRAAAQPHSEPASEMTPEEEGAALAPEGEGAALAPEGEGAALAPEGEGYIVWGAAVEPEGASILHIGAEEIERHGALGVAQALERHPAVAGSTGSRGERILQLRGFEQRQTLVLVDGVPAYLPYDGQVDLSMFPTAAVDHVTVIKGPSPLLLGPNGLGGAVNIVTRKPGEGPLLSAGIEVAGSGATHLAAAHSLKRGPFGYTVHGGHDQRPAWWLSSRFVPTRLEDGGQRTNSDRRRSHGGGSARLELGRDHQLRVSALFVDGAHGVPPSALALPRYWRFSSWRQLGGSVAHQGRAGPLEFDERVFVHRFENTLDGFDDASFTAQSSARGFRSQYDDLLAGAGARARLVLDDVPGGVAALQLWSALQLDRHLDVPGPDQVPLVDSRATVSAAPLLDYYLRWGGHLIGACQLDLELPGDTAAGASAPSFAVSPLLALRYSPVNGLVMGASVARRTRFPTLKERFSRSLDVRLPNPDLGPEHAWHLGLEGSYVPSPRLAISASLFDAEVAGLIERVPLPDGREQIQNVGAARLAGAEVEARVVAGYGVEVAAGYATLWARRTDRAPPADALALRPEHQAVLEGVGRLFPWLELSSAARLVGPRPVQDPRTLRWERMPTYAVWDARVAVVLLRGLEVWVRGTNLLDSSFETQPGFPDPGRELWVGARLRPAAG